MPLTVTSSPKIRPVTALVIVTVVPLSVAAVIGLSGPPHVAGIPQPGGIVPAAHPGIDPVAVKVSATGS